MQIVVIKLFIYLETGNEVREEVEGELRIL